jgi:hypothetical protein
MNKILGKNQAMKQMLIKSYKKEEKKEEKIKDFLCRVLPYPIGDKKEREN